MQNIPGTNRNDASNYEKVTIINMEHGPGE